MIVRHQGPRAALAIVRACAALAPTTYLEDLRAATATNGAAQAVREHDTPALFTWLVEVFELQGISNRAAWSFADENGRVSWQDLAEAVTRPSRCPRLRHYWAFADCGFTRSAATCGSPERYAACGLPRLPSRNGRLAQGAASLFLFIRDVCDGDLVAWIDDRLDAADGAALSPLERSRRLREALLAPMRHIFGVSDKVLAMTLAQLLLGADPRRERWQVAGAGMIAVDSLVHNFLHRTGILTRLNARHVYGPRCYDTNGCRDVIEALSEQIDASAIDPSYPAYFPRLVQSAIWRFCAADGWDICNGNRIDDDRRCENRHCPLGERCQRESLRPAL